VRTVGDAFGFVAAMQINKTGGCQAPRFVFQAASPRKPARFLTDIA
jgi:hypothetical protein